MSLDDVLTQTNKMTSGDDRSVAGSAAEVAALAKKLQVPVGWLLLADPPLERLPFPDLRSPDRYGQIPSGNLLDAIYLCQQRQQWCREHSNALGNESSVPKWLVTRDMTEAEAATVLRDSFDLESARKRSNDEGTFRAVADAIEDSGVMVMVAGIYRSFSHRKFDIKEFRCLILNDDVAPLLFLNGRDKKPAQTFTLLHGYLHLCLGDSGVDDVEIHCDSETPNELWCNRVVTNALLPQDTLRAHFDATVPIGPELERLAQRGKVTPLAVCRQALETELIDRPTFESQYQRFTDQAERFAITERKETGGDYYKTVGARLGRRFTDALVQDTWEGRTLFRDAYRLADIGKHRMFMNFTEIGRGNVSA